MAAAYDNAPAATGASRDFLGGSSRDSLSARGANRATDDDDVEVDALVRARSLEDFSSGVFP